MSYSPKKRNKSVINKSITTDKIRNSSKNLVLKKVYSPTHHNYIIKLIPSDETSSTKNTNNSFLKEKEISNNIHQIKIDNSDEEEEKDIKNNFVQKQKSVYLSPMTIDNKKLTFQRQKDGEILEFSLFNDELVFKDINKAFLQDEHNDDGDESSDEKIANGKELLFEEIEEATKEFEKYLKKNQNKQLLSRKMRFKTNE